ncbi:MAG: IS110 family transposase [Promethearchaeota archaeon]|nr:MAG: IS110 family transposase [Candidatus Lokiarchaeota archaeon]
MKVIRLKKDSHLRTRYQYGAGLDIHKATIVAAVCAQSPSMFKKLAVQQFRRTPQGLGEMCKFLSKHLIKTIVMESTGVYTPQVRDFLQNFQHWKPNSPEIIVINPSLLRKFPGEIHADTVDAVELARLGLLGLARHSHLPHDKLRELRRVTRQVHYVMKDSTRAKNRIKQNLDFFGLSLPGLDLNSQWVLELLRVLITPSVKGNFGNSYHAVMRGTISTKKSTQTALKRRVADFTPYFPITLPRSALKCLEMYLADLSVQEGMLGILGTEIEHILNETASLRDSVQRLTALPGVDEKTAAILLSEIGEVQRFPTQKQFLQYVGCSPTIYQSGTIEHGGHLNKRVNHFAKRAFFNIGKVICSIVKQDSDLKEYGRKQLNRYWNAKKLAWMKTGIKAARIMYKILKTEAEYVPFYESQNDQKVCTVNSERTSTIQLKELRKRTRRYLKYVNSVSEQASAQARAKVYSILHKLWIETEALHT